MKTEIAIENGRILKLSQTGHDHLLTPSSTASTKPIAMNE